MAPLWEPPIADDARNIGWTGWGPREPDPTTVIALWPSDEAPTRTEVLAALAQAGFESRSDLEAEPVSTDTLWTAVLQSTDKAMPIVVWAEPAQPSATAGLGDAEADQCKWIVGVQSVLNGDDPLPSLVALLRCASTGAPDTPAVLDVNARRWLPRSQLAMMLGDDAPLPPSELLWTIEVVTRGEAKRDAHDNGASDVKQLDGASTGTAWLRTQGLARCGRPELEMLEVPADSAAVAATLLNDIAELLLEAALPEPGEPLEIGVGLSIVLQPWSAVGPFLNQDSAGNIGDRQARGLAVPGANGSLDGDVAFVCAAQPVGQFRKLWVWPREIARRLAEDGAAVYRTTRATERAAALAQHTWPELAMTWAKARRADAQEEDSPGAVVLIKVGFEVGSGDDTSREHLWFIVREIAGDQARGQLINQPVHATAMQEGDEVWVNREGVSDWRLILPGAIVQPSDMLLQSPMLDRAMASLEHASW